MSLEIALAENTAAIRELIAKLSTGATIPQDTQAEKPATTAKNTKATKTDPKSDAAPASEQTQPASDSSSSSSSESTATGNASYDDAKAAVLRLSKEKGREAAVDALSRFGVTKLPDLDKDSYGALVDLVEEVLAGIEV
ncbi:hypothetical protein H0A64_07050 [Alcaligenaceae bacterium]|nr:hypothetical protein [Alcaligenaceae bacterium]